MASSRPSSRQRPRQIHHLQGQRPAPARSSLGDSERSPARPVRVRSCAAVARCTSAQASPAPGSGAAARPGRRQRPATASAGTAPDAPARAPAPPPARTAPPPPRSPPATSAASSLRPTGRAGRQPPPGDGASGHLRAHPRRPRGPARPPRPGPARPARPAPAIPLAPPPFPGRRASARTEARAAVPTTAASRTWGRLIATSPPRGAQRATQPEEEPGSALEGAVIADPQGHGAPHSLRPAAGLFVINWRSGFLATTSKPSARRLAGGRRVGLEVPLPLARRLSMRSTSSARVSSFSASAASARTGLSRRSAGSSSGRESSSLTARARRLQQIAPAADRLALGDEEARARRLDRGAAPASPPPGGRPRPGRRSRSPCAQLVVQPRQLVVPARVLGHHAAVLVDGHELAAAQRRDLPPHGLGLLVVAALDGVQRDPLLGRQPRRRARSRSRPDSRCGARRRRPGR